MTDKLFDDFVKDKLRDHSSSVPDNMWERIMQEPTKKPKGFFYLYSTRLFFYILAAVLIFGGLWYAQSDDTATPLSKAYNAAEKTKLTKESANEKANTASAQQQTKPSTDFSNKTNQPENSDNSLTKSTNNADDKLATSDSKLVQSSTTSALVKNNQSAFNKNNQQVFLSKASYKKQQGIFGKARKQLAAANQDKQATGFTNVDDYFTLNPSFNYASSALAKKEFQANNINQLLTNFKGLFGKVDDCPTARGPRKNELFIEVYGSPDYVQKTTTPTSYGNLSYLKRKDSLETMRGSYTAGIRLSKTLGEHFLIKAGLQYSQVNERFDYRNENERRIVTVVTIRTIIRNPGDTITVRDTSMIEQVGTRVKTTYNRYRSIDIPIILGYEWGGEKFRASVNAGLILNTYSWQQGETLDTNYIPVAFNSKSAIGFKQNIGLGLYAGISLNKKIGTDTELFFEPYFRYNLSNMTKTRSAFNQRFNAAGVSIGIRYRLASFGQHYPGR